MNHSKATNFGASASQSSINPLGTGEQTKQDTLSVNPFGSKSNQPALPSDQAIAQPPQTSNMFGQITPNPFQSQTSQSLANIFGQTATQPSQPSNSNVGGSTIPPNHNEDSMATSPDSSPQSNQKTPQSSFSFLQAHSQPNSSNGTAEQATGRSLFDRITPRDNGQVAASAPTTAFNQSSAAENHQAKIQQNAEPSAHTTEISASPSKTGGASSPKNRQSAQPSGHWASSAGDSSQIPNPFSFVTKPTAASDPSVLTKDDNSQTQKSFAFLNTPSSGTKSSSSMFASPFASQKGKETAPDALKGSTSDIFGKSTQVESPSQTSTEIRHPGSPPVAPADFTDQQKRQLVTGYRLKALDIGLSDYLNSKRNTKSQLESIQRFYEERKAAILNADGSPMEEIGNKRPSDDDQGQNSLERKKARLEPPSASAESPQQSSEGAVVSNGTALKRKADKDLGQGEDYGAFNSPKRQQKERDISYPSLPSTSSGSETAKKFGSILRRDSQEVTSGVNEATPNTNQNSNTFEQPGRLSESVSPSVFNKTQSSLFPSAPTNSFAFGTLNKGSADQDRSKRKAADLEPSGTEASDQEDEDAPAQLIKKQRVNKNGPDSDKENNDAKWAQNPIQAIGSGESIFSKPRSQPANTFNIFGNLSKPSTDDHNNDSDDEERNTRDAPVENTTAGQSDERSSRTSTDNPLSSAISNRSNAISGSSIEKPKPTMGSLFDRIEKDENGKPVKAPLSNGQNLGQSVLKTPKVQSASNIFGQPSQPTSETPSSTPSFNLFGANFSSLGNKPEDDSKADGDNTWKAGSQISFANTPKAPDVKITSASPSKTPLGGGLFGALKPSTIPDASNKSTSNLFFPSTSNSITGSLGKSPLIGHQFGAPREISNATLAPPSNSMSNNNSRATSPGATTGATTGESGNDSEGDEVYANETHPELSSAEAAEAEEMEDVIFDVKAKLYEFADSKEGSNTKKNWVVRGTDQFRVLKHRDTKKTRMVMRLQVNGRIVLNSGLAKSLKYVHSKPKIVEIPVPKAPAVVQSWMVRVSKDEDAERLAAILEENKSY